MENSGVDEERMMSPWQHSKRTTWDYVVECNKTNMGMWQYNIQPLCDSIGDPPLGDNQCSPWWTFIHTDCTTNPQELHKHFAECSSNRIDTSHGWVKCKTNDGLKQSAKQAVSHVIVMWDYDPCSPKVFSVISYNSYIIFYPLLVRQQHLH